jgi:hypothetical protein
MMSDDGPSKAELAELDGIVLREDGLLQAKIARNANVGAVDADDPWSVRALRRLRDALTR